MRGNAMASTGRYATAQTGAPKLRTQPPATGITSCRVAFTPATFQAHSRRSTNSVISNGRGGTPRDGRDRAVYPGLQVDVSVHACPR